MNSKDIDRRGFLKVAGKTTAGFALSATGLTFLPASLAQAASKNDEDNKYDFVMPRAKFDCKSSRVIDQWNTVPGGDRQLLESLSSVIRCKVKVSTNCRGPNPGQGQEKHFTHLVEFNDIDEMRKYAFIFMTASGEYEFNDRQKKNLEDYLLGGGFILMDDCVDNDSNGDFFFRSSYELLEEVFGRDAVRPIPLDHEVFHNIYDLGNSGLPYIQGQQYPAQGLFIDKRLAVFLSSTDIHCGWAYLHTGSFNNCEQAIQMGINVIMYSISH